MEMSSQSDTSGLLAKIVELERAGLTEEQCQKLLRMRERVCNGEYRGDDLGSPTGDLALDRRLEFVRWLVQHGQFAEHREAPRCRHGTGE